MVQSPWKTIWQNVKDRVILRPSNFTLMYTPKSENICPPKTCTQMFIAALLIKTKLWKYSKCLPTTEWTMEYYTAVQMNEP